MDLNGCTPTYNFFVSVLFVFEIYLLSAKSVTFLFSEIFLIKFEINTNGFSSHIYADIAFSI